MASTEKKRRRTAPKGKGSSSTATKRESFASLPQPVRESLGRALLAGESLGSLASHFRHHPTEADPVLADRLGAVARATKAGVFAFLVDDDRALSDLAKTARAFLRGRHRGRNLDVASLKPAGTWEGGWIALVSDLESERWETVTYSMNAWEAFSVGRARSWDDVPRALAEDVALVVSAPGAFRAFLGEHDVRLGALSDEHYEALVTRLEGVARKVWLKAPPRGAANHRPRKLIVQVLAACLRDLGAPTKDVDTFVRSDRRS